MKSTKRLFLALALLSTINHPLSIFAQGAAFTYQGRLNDGGNPATGIYDLRFTIYDLGSGGSAVAGPLTNSATGVSNGLFTVALDFGNSPFSGGAARWLGIEVRTNGGSGFAGLSPRQPFTAVPYSITASNLTGALPVAQLSGTVANGQLANSSVNVSAGSGLSGGGAVALGGTTTLANAGVLSVGASPPLSSSGGQNPSISLTGSVNAATLGGLSASNFWQNGGNAGANPTNGAFLGTTDNLPMEIKVNGQRALRIEPATVPNLIGGFTNNNVTAGKVGAFIGGGGSFNNQQNHVTVDYGVVGGGGNNQAGDAAGSHSAATVGGGFANTASGDDSTIAGGYNNNAGGDRATVGGGQGNSAGGARATVSGGDGSAANGTSATVPGGLSNLAGGAYSLAAGRRAKAVNDGTLVWADSTDADFSSTASNQFLVRAGGGVGINTNNPGTNALQVIGTVAATRFVGDGSGLTGISGGGGGTVTSVATGAGLTGGPITTSGTISIASGGVANSMLANPSVTVAAGTGLGGGGAVSLGGTTTLNNAGVLGVTAASPLSSSGGQNPQISLTGNIPDAQLSVNIARLNGTNLFTGTNNFANATILTNTANTFAGSFTGNGAGLTNLDIASLAIPPGMALIPAGAFTMGDNLDGESDATPISVTVSAFYMDVNLVSLSQWQSVYFWATNNGYNFVHAGSGKAANNPVQTVDWYDTVKWCNARSQQAG